jgi:hypothetical protein
LPEVSRFLGIIIRFYYNEHLPPHFHAEYGEHRAQIAIGSHTVIHGNLPGRVLSLVLNRKSQIVNRTSPSGEVPDKIAPLV